MKTIKIQCPAKINLDLRVYPRDKKTGYHDIKSIMQTINLYDYITLELEEGDEIILSGTSDEIPYNKENLCYKAAELFFKKINKSYKLKIYIEKNIPVCAGLAGGSTDAAGVLYGLNKLLNSPLKDSEMDELALKLGSDLNFCLRGGTKLCKGRGEKIIDMPFFNFKLSLIKPKNLKISAKEAYEAFDKLKKESTMRNDLEFALIETKKYPEINYLSSLNLQMSGSGPTFFAREEKIELKNDNYLIINNLNSINYGTREV